MLLSLFFLLVFLLFTGRFEALFLVVSLVVVRLTAVAAAVAGSSLPTLPSLPRFTLRPIQHSVADGDAILLVVVVVRVGATTNAAAAGVVDATAAIHIAKTSAARTKSSRWCLDAGGSTICPYSMFCTVTRNANPLSF